MTPSRTLVLVAGASGSGKSRLARTSGRPLVQLDDFYRDGDEPGLPRTLGIVDWDDPASWHLAASVQALATLCGTGSVVLPRYAIAANARVGEHSLTLADHDDRVVAEGVFALEVLRPARAAGIDVQPIWLDRPRTLTFVLRLVRDLRERRKPPLVLLRRGLRHWQQEPVKRRRALALGFEPLSMRAALARLRRTGGAGHRGR